MISLHSKGLRCALLASAATSVFWSSNVLAEEAGNVPASSDQDTIVVTARRESEVIQDVPVTVQAISGETLKQLGIVQAEELSKIAPGLNLQPVGTGGANAGITLRGVRWAAGAGQVAIPVYVNEVAFGPSTGLQSLYDVGQIEVLRGPQGTTRGASSISGAITLTTRKPDMDEFSGYVQGTYGDSDRLGAQGGVSIPLVKDVLALRVAGFYDRGNGNSVVSRNNAISPRLENKSGRVTMALKPTSNFDISAMYQRFERNTRFYNQVSGPGVGFNGPAITADQYLAVQNSPTLDHQTLDSISVNTNWEVLGHRLSYNFGHEAGSFGVNENPDVAHFLGTFPMSRRYTSQFRLYSHEFRLSSLRGDHTIDYDLGYYRVRSPAATPVDTPVYLPGAFGFAPDTFATPLARYTLNVHLDIATPREEDSIYGNVHLHLPSDIELSAGVRHVNTRLNFVSTTTLGSAFVAAIPNPTPIPDFSIPQLPCEALGSLDPRLAIAVSGTFAPAVCDVALSASSSTQANNARLKKWLYNVSLSKKFGENVLVYATVGSAARLGPGRDGIIGAFLGQARPEKATSYELGLKTSPAPGVKFNLSVYQIDYKDQLVIFQGVPFFDPTTATGIGRTSLSFYWNVDSRVRGIEGELSYEPRKGINIGAVASYSTITDLGKQAEPCATGPAISATNFINTCPGVRRNINASPKFQGTIYGSFTQGLTESIDGYLRFNLNYQGSSPNFGISFPQTPTPAYAVVDLFVGANSEKAGWDIGFYAKNMFDVRKQLTRLPTDPQYTLFGASAGYDVVTMNRPREIGVTLRYSFGSR